MTRSIKSLKKSLYGQIEWIGATKGRSDPVFRRYAIEYNGLFGEKIELGPDLSRLSTLSIWVLETTHPDPNAAGDTQGTAFFLKNVGLITAAHGLPEEHSYEVFCVDELGKRCSVTLRQKHDHVDLAIPDHTIPSHHYVELSRAEREPNGCEETSLWGFPAYSVGNRIEDRRGRVVSHPTKSAVSYLCVDQKINQGNSGGPLLNSVREVVGVAHKGGPGEAQDLAVKIQKLTAL